MEARGGGVCMASGVVVYDEDVTVQAMCACMGNRGDCVGKKGEAGPGKWCSGKVEVGSIVGKVQSSGGDDLPALPPITAFPLPRAPS